jgi:hypothetical protein
MLFGETVAVYRENHTEHTNTLCGHNTEFFLTVKAGGTYTKHNAERERHKSIPIHSPTLFTI